MLMHVAPDEVAKLQRAAKAQGGSLSINPDTGLPEADFFSELNPLNPNSGISKSGVAPLLVGAALGPAGFNLMSAANAGFLYGGITALSSGDLGKGLMAGLGAYGGANLAAGLSGMGASALASDPSSAFYANSMDRASDLASGMQGSAASGASFADKLGAGTSFAGSNPKAALAALGSGSAWKGAGILGAAVSPMLAAKMVKTTTPPAQTQSLIRPYTYTARATTPTNMVGTQYRPGEDTSERNWMTGNFTAQTPYKAPGPEYAAEGGVVKMAAGGVPDLYGNLQKYAYNPALTQFDPAAGSVNYGRLPRYRFNPLTGRFELLPASVDASMPSDTSGAGYGGGDGGGGGGGNMGDTGNSGIGSTSSTNSSDGQGVSSGMQSLGLGLMSLGQAPGVVTGALGSIGQSISDSQMEAMSDVSNTISTMNALGQTVTTDANGNVVNAPTANNAVASDNAAVATDAAATDTAAISDAVAADSAAVATDAANASASAAQGSESDAAAASAASTAAAAVGEGGGAPGMGGDSPSGDSGGGGGGGGAGGCFLTTAAVSHMNQKDNGKVLNTLREFRDTYMRKNKESSKDIAWYYENAPRIVAALDKRDDADKVYKKMYRDFIKPAYTAIQKGDNEYAYEIYKDGIDFAKKHSGINKKALTPRYGPNGMASGGIAMLASGGLGNLGGYSDGGRLLRGPGDGVSDSIPAQIGNNQPARLADGEFVVPARIVSELGNGSTEAGARQLYKMMDRVQKARGKTTGKEKVAKNTNAAKYLPA
jgi:hypothetical protein